MDTDKNAPQPMNAEQTFKLKQLEIKHRALMQEYKTTVGVHRYYKRMHEAVTRSTDDEAISFAIDAMLTDIMLAAERQRRLDRSFATYELMYERLETVLKRLGDLVAALEEIALIPFEEARIAYDKRSKKDA